MLQFSPTDHTKTISEQSTNLAARPSISSLRYLIRRFCCCLLFPNGKWHRGKQNSASLILHAGVTDSNPSQAIRKQIAVLIQVLLHSVFICQKKTTEAPHWRTSRLHIFPVLNVRLERVFQTKSLCGLPT